MGVEPTVLHGPWQSPILSVYRVAVPFRFTMWGDMFANIDRIQEIDCPVFVIHGTRDEVVPFEHGQVGEDDA
jgi:abhydrolase domain-containing protein 17